MNLSERQKKYLRGLGHHLKPLITVGENGVSKNLLFEFNETLDHHELIKVKVRASDRHARNTIINSICEDKAIQIVQRIGNIVLVYRANPKKEPEKQLRIPSYHS
ncbi:MAG: ribosome assembly RNA-binding protein YhbY [Woeseia sp.]|nr:ribosome assembly RNA-binding protein YhbY [Woeseia sp.]|tara:strand:+ start:10321 stop:10635 length:315 start_codon:yes stop_codon:yes gene_type:complete